MIVWPAVIYVASPSWSIFVTSNSRANITSGINYITTTSTRRHDSPLICMCIAVLDAFNRDDIYFRPLSQLVIMFLFVCLSNFVAVFELLCKYIH